MIETINNAETFGIYWRAFLTIASFLKNKYRLTDREISTYFLQGMDNTFRTKMHDQLRAENPTHHSDNPYILTEISKAALFILSCNPPEDTRNEGSQGLSFKKEHYNISKLDPNFLNENINISALVSEIVKQLSLQPARLSGTQGPASTSAPRIKNWGCLFCLEIGHLLKGCTGQLDGCKLLEYK